MGKLLLLIGLYYLIRFIFRFVYPTFKAYTQIKKNVQNNNAGGKSNATKESLYAKKGEYIEYEEIS